MSIPAARMHVHAPSCSWFWAWAAVGFAGALGVISFAIGPFAAIPAAVAGVLLARSEQARGSVFGLLAGAGLLLSVVAWVNRGGPLNPLPWLGAGLLLIAAGVAGQRTHR